MALIQSPYFAFCSQWLDFHLIKALKSDFLLSLMQNQALKPTFFITDIFYWGLLQWMGEDGIGCQTSKRRANTSLLFRSVSPAGLWDTFWGGSGKGQSSRAGQAQRWPGALGIGIQVQNKHWSASLSLKHPRRPLLLVCKRSSSETSSGLFSEKKKPKKGVLGLHGQACFLTAL